MCFLLAALAIPASASTKITYTIQGNPTCVHWSKAAFPLAIQVDRRVANAFPGAQQVVERAFTAWTQVPDVDVRFQPIELADNLSVGSDQRNVVTIADGLMSGQGALAMTTYTFDDRTGAFLDADIQLDKSLLQGDYNIQMTVQHEIGHMLGLDHSAVLSSVMYPWVPKGTATPVFDSDDNIGIATHYPNRNVDLLGATLRGRVIGDQGGIFAAQVVAINELGQPVATTLSDSTGEFTLQALPEGTYRLYAEPLDGPFDTRNLNGVYRSAKVLPFATKFLSDEIRVTGGQVVGNLHMAAVGTATLNPKWIAASFTGKQDFSLTTSSVGVKPGDTVMLAVAGDGFTSGMTTFEVMNPAFRRVSDFKWSQNFVSATFVVDSSAAPGSSVVLVKSGHETATLTGALRVQKPMRRRAS
jgi:Matrixin/Carboxypeptidase regulatory-like domain